MLENPLKFLKPAALGLLFAVGIFFGYEIGKSYVDSGMSIYQEKFDEPAYFKVFDELPEGSIGDAYINFFNEL